MKQGAGLIDRILYISEHAWIMAPRIEASLRALAHRFPARLVLVKAVSFGHWASLIRLRRVRAQEYQFIGSSLQEAYEDDYGFKKYWNEAPLEGMLRFRVGEVPRGVNFMFLHEVVVSFGRWAQMDVVGMLRVEEESNERGRKRDEKSSEVLGEMLKAKATKKDPATKA